MIIDEITDFRFFLVVAMVILRIKEVVPIVRDDEIGSKKVFFSI